jgi:hypothetical protein
MGLGLRAVRPLCLPPLLNAAIGTIRRKTADGAGLSLRRLALKRQFYADQEIPEKS